jgi:hypothetical protein
LLGAADGASKIADKVRENGNKQYDDEGEKQDVFNLYAAALIVQKFAELTIHQRRP